MHVPMKCKIVTQPSFNEMLVMDSQVLFMLFVERKFRSNHIVGIVFAEINHGTNIFP